ncbi:hypothetical protein K438DRAFT_373020 [Mycena galopus ATCC 62051]|nr:hypothetical protein K438DRAFT_373020 [Mycena galopus ATCC 62051]
MNWQTHSSNVRPKGIISIGAIRNNRASPTHNYLSRPESFTSRRTISSRGCFRSWADAGYTGRHSLRKGLGGNWLLQQRLNQAIANPVRPPNFDSRHTNCFMASPTFFPTHHLPVTLFRCKLNFRCNPSTATRPLTPPFDRRIRRLNTRPSLIHLGLRPLIHSSTAFRMCVVSPLSNQSWCTSYAPFSPARPTHRKRSRWCSKEVLG